MSDALVLDHGSVVIIRLITQSAREWATAWLDTQPDDRTARLGRRDADIALEGMREDGLVLTGEYNA